METKKIVYISFKVSEMYENFREKKFEERKLYIFLSKSQKCMKVSEKNSLKKEKKNIDT